MKRTLISLLCGLGALGVWGAIIVATSQDFSHEGPNSRYFAPIDLWARTYQTKEWNHACSELPFAVQIVVGVTALLGPFLMLFSSISYAIISSLASHSASRRHVA